MLLSAEMLHPFEKEHGLRCEAFSLTAVKGACLSNPTYKKGFSAIVGREHGSAAGEHSENTSVKAVLLYKAKAEMKRQTAKSVRRQESRPSQHVGFSGSAHFCSALKLIAVLPSFVSEDKNQL